MTRHWTVQYLGACLFPTMPMPFCRGRTNVCVTRQHVRRAILSPSVGRVVCCCTLRSLCCRMPCRQRHCRHADGGIRSSAVPCATTGAHAGSSQQCAIYHRGHERTVPHRFSSSVKRSGVGWQGNLAAVLSPPRERTQKCTETSPRGSRDCPYALSVSASSVRLDQDRRVCGCAMRHQDNRHEVADYGSTREVSSIFSRQQIAGEPGPCTGSSCLRIEPQCRGIS